MSPGDEHTASSPHIQDIVTQARTLIDGSEVSDPLAREIGAAVIRIGEQAMKGISPLISSPQYAPMLQALETLLHSVQEQSTWPVAVAPEPGRYTDDWWEDTRQSLHQRIDEDEARGWETWLTTYASALADWRLDICERLLAEPFRFFPNLADQMATFEQGTFGLQTVFPEDALGMLNTLVDMTNAETGQPLIQATDRGLLLIVLGRIHLYSLQNAQDAKLRFEQAREFLPNDGLPAAALGEYYRLEVPEDGGGEPAEAANPTAVSHFQEALDRPSGHLDAMIGMGLLFEDDQEWDASDDWYARALDVALPKKSEDTDVELVAAELDRHLRPVSANVYLQLGRMLSKKKLGAALKALDIAIDQAHKRASQFRLRYDGSYTERIGYRLEAQLLERLKRPDEAALAYYEAGRRFALIGEYHIGIDLLWQAQRLAPEHAPTYWELADALRGESAIPDPPYVDAATITKSRDLSDMGFALQLPEADGSWVYTSRALIDEQWALLPTTHRARAWWEAVTYLERAIVHDEEDPFRWAYLARIHQLLAHDASVLDATARVLAGVASLELDASHEEVLSELENLITSEDGADPLATLTAVIGDPSPLLTSLEECASSLSNVGPLDEALRTIDLRLRIEPSPWGNVQMARILIDTEESAAALELINQAIDDVPANVWFREVRALCLRSMERRENARGDLEWIWQEYQRRRDQGVDDIDNLESYAWAAYSLELYDEARAILERLLDDMPFFGAYPSYVPLLLGVCYLGLNDLKKAEEFIREGIRRAPTKRRLEIFLADELAEAERASAQWPHGTEARDLIARLHPLIQRRMREIEEHGPSSSAGDLKQVIEHLPTSDDPDSWVVWARAGARAGLARLHAEAGQLHEAMDDYTALIDDDAARPHPVFPEARLGLTRALEELSWSARQRGDLHEVTRWRRRLAEMDPSRALEAELEIAAAYQEGGEVDTALEHFRAAMDLAPSLESRLWIMVLMGDALASAGRWDEAGEYYTDSFNATAAGDDATLQMTLQVRLGTAAVARGEQQDAIGHLRTALNAPLPLLLFGDYEKALMDSVQLLPPNRPRLALSDALRELTDDQSIDQFQRDQLESAQAELVRAIELQLLGDTEGQPVD